MTSGLAQTIQFFPLAPIPLIAALAAAALALVAVALIKRAPGALFRLAFFAAMVLALLDPRAVREDRTPQPDETVVIIDRTSSQNTGERLQQTSEAEEAILAALDQFPGLDTRIVEVSDSGASARPGSRLTEALTAAMAEIPKSRFAGAIIVTDGQVHDLPQSQDGKPKDPRLRGPMHVLLTGKRGESDRRLVVNAAPGYGIVGKDVTVTYTIEDKQAEAKHKMDGGAVTGRASARVRLSVDGVEREQALAPVGQAQKFTFKLEHAGPSLAEISVEPAEGELSEVNNRALVSVNGVRDRLRVLLISGQPHAAERTWRNLLKSDPSVDLVHFTILRPPDKDDFTPLNELALIAFPTHELFVERLDEFDLIVFDRYLKRGVLQAQHLDNIAKRVRDGGALLMAVGPEYTGRNSLYNTALRDVLPAAPTGDMVESAFLPRISGAGEKHPVTAPLTRLGRPGDAGPALPTDRPAWGRWFRQVPGQAESGVTVMTGAQDKPLLLLGRIGKGRVAQMMSDHIWLWARGIDGGGPQGELLRRMAHWLMREPDLEEERLQARVRGGKLTIERRTLGDQADKVTVTSPPGVQREITLEAAGPGRWRADLTAAEIGLYRITDGTRTALVASGELNPLELSDLRATDRLLKPLTETAGGSIRWLTDGIPDLRRVDPHRDLAGRSWIGLVAHKSYVVTGLRDIPLLVGLILVALTLSALMMAWWREGR
ncbi:MAG: hypothetical protein VW268_01615 [Rhodospirillaceae bacterium]